MEFISTIARKIGNPFILAIESTKSILAHEIGKNSGLFYVPRVLNFDSKAGILDFERIEGLICLQELVIAEDRRLFSLLRKIGQGVAIIHEQLTLPNEMKHEFPPEWVESSGKNVFLHADLSCRNVCYQEQTETLVILDWSGAPLIGRMLTYGSRFFDILWFIGCFFRGTHKRKNSDFSAETMANIFLKSYAHNISAEDWSGLSNYVSKICDLQKKNIWYLEQQLSFPRIIASVMIQLLMYKRFSSFLRCYKL